VEPSLRFYKASQTVNEALILSAIRDKGELVFSATESALAHKFERWRGECFYADVLALFRKEKRDYLVGIEVKDWGARITRKLCRQYLDTYGRSVEYFYLAGRKFSPSIWAIPRLGLIDLDRLEVVKKARYLYPDKKLRAGVVKVLKEYKGAPEAIQEDPYQMSLGKFGDC
jgi:hypothetical protein